MVNQKELSRIFPQTLESLRVQKMESVVTDFNRFCVDDLNHSRDVSGWFPVFLKAHGYAPELTEICHYEWLKFSCLSMDWGETKLDQGQLGLAPGVQFINLEKAAKRLSHQPGPVVIFAKNGQAQARSLLASEALCLDVLSEDRKFNKTQLVDFLKMEGKNVPSLQKTDWDKVVQQLIEEKILNLKS